MSSPWMSSLPNTSTLSRQQHCQRRRLNVTGRKGHLNYWAFPLADIFTRNKYLHTMSYPEKSVQITFLLDPPYNQSSNFILSKSLAWWLIWNTLIEYNSVSQVISSSTQNKKSDTPFKVLPPEYIDFAFSADTRLPHRNPWTRRTLFPLQKLVSGRVVI